MNQALVVAALIVPSVAVVAWAVRLLVVARRSASWPTADATIVVSRVEGPSNATWAHIEFAYAVDGRAYIGRRIAIGPRVSTSGSAAERMVTAHPVGSHATIGYDRRDPAYAVLKRGVLPRHVVVVVGAVAALVMTVGGGVAFVLMT